MYAAAASFSGLATRSPDLRGRRGFLGYAARSVCQSYVVCPISVAARTRSPSNRRTPSWVQSTSDAPGPLRTSGTRFARRRSALASVSSRSGSKLARTVSAGRVVSAASVRVAIGVSAPRKRMRQPLERNRSPKESRPMSCCSPSAHASSASGPLPRLLAGRSQAICKRSRGESRVCCPRSRRDLRSLGGGTSPHDQRSRG